MEGPPQHLFPFRIFPFWQKWSFFIIFFIPFYVFKFMLPTALNSEHRDKERDIFIQVWKCIHGDVFMQYIFLFWLIYFPVSIFILHYKVMSSVYRVVFRRGGGRIGNRILSPSLLLRLGQSYAGCRQKWHKAHNE
jgi:hypothetical protein